MSYIRIRRHNDILWLILDHPPLNILTIAMLDQLTTAIHEALKNSPRLVVITGAGEKAFSAGVDIHDHLDGRAQAMLRAMYDNCAAFAELRQRKIPTAALVKGCALGGGCELAALCDTIMADERATFGLSELSLGILPPVAAVYFPALIGRKAAMRLILTGETISAQEAFRLGFVHQILPSRYFLADAEELLTVLASDSSLRSE